MYLDRKFGLNISLSEITLLFDLSLYLDRKFGLSLSLSEITLLFDLKLDLDRTLDQWKAQWQAKSKVSHPMSINRAHYARY